MSFSSTLKCQVGMWVSDPGYKSVVLLHRNISLSVNTKSPKVCPLCILVPST